MHGRHAKFLNLVVLLCRLLDAMPQKLAVLVRRLLVSTLGQSVHRIWCTAACAIFLAAVIAATICSSASVAQQERPVNFIFLVDTSGSMVMKSTMVSAAGGQQITLFEALRQALIQLAQDRRLISPASRIAFVTFGTDVNEKTDWPSKIESDADREKLLAMIRSPESLSADKHGDTYMGGALAHGLKRANELYALGDPCTTTFIVMMTDGWDEPPKGAEFNVRSVAADVVKRKREIAKNVGVDTWHIRVVGLQRLPDSKAGTTTAKELAALLKGEFLDVSSSGGGTVSDRIFQAVKKSVEGLRGEIKVAGQATAGGAFVDFGTVTNAGDATAPLGLEVKSCYAEDVTSARECSKEVNAPEAKRMLTKLPSGAGGVPLTQVSSLNNGAISITLLQPQYSLSPKVGEGDQSKQSQGISQSHQNIDLKLHAHSNCPAGRFVGFFKIASTALTPPPIAYLVSVPARIVAEPEMIAVRIKKPGFFWNESTEVELEATLKQPEGAHGNTPMQVEVTADPPLLKSGDGKKFQESKIDLSNLNGGKPIALSFDSSKGNLLPLKMSVFIPADQKPGVYRGVLHVKLSGAAETIAPSEIPFDIDVRPSAWEEVAPVAVPIIVGFILIVSAATILWLMTMRRD